MIHNMDGFVLFSHKIFFINCKYCYREELLYLIRQNQNKFQKKNSMNLHMILTKIKFICISRQQPNKIDFIIVVYFQYFMFFSVYLLLIEKLLLLSKTEYNTYLYFPYEFQF